MKATTSRNKEPIAIVGIGCNFPGEAHGPDRFWKLLVSGTDAITDVPADRWSTAFYYDPEQGKPAKTYSKWGGFVSGINLFDPVPFGIPEREAQFMDPQQRLLLESTWEALEDAGMQFDLAKPKHVGVFVGISTFDYALLQSSPGEYNEADPYSATGTSLSIAANRISYCFNFTGPSLIVDTACSSALTALNMACRSIWNGECEAAVAGGVNALLSPSTYVAFCTISMLSPDGRCKAFDQRANGFVRSEGSGMVVLKPLSAAQAAGDRIYALIRETGTNQDGRTPGMTVPSQESQEMLIRHVCHNAGINPAEIQYVEAHGTGTAVGDPIEARALGGALGAGRAAGSYCRIGSVKTNLGHLEAGSGIAGLIKTALSLHHGVIPPSLHFETPNPNIDFEALRLRVVTEVEPFAPGRRLAGLNSFGFGGANAHALLEAVNGDAPKTRRKPVAGPVATEAQSNGNGVPSGQISASQLLVLAARSEEALKSQVENWASFLDTTPDPLPDICRAAATQRVQSEYRVAAVAASPAEMAGLLRGYSGGENPAFVVSHRLPERQKAPPIVFVYSGQGPQWWAMGRELWHQEPVFRKKIEECSAALRGLAKWNLQDELLADEADSRMAQTEIAQPAITAVQIALTALWAAWGVRPAAVVGHSVGEVAAAHTAGIYSLKDAMRVIYHRGHCMERAPLRGKMIAVGVGPDEATTMIKNYGDRLSLAACNAPHSVSISGDADAVDELAAHLEKLGRLVRTVPVNYAFHSAHMDPVRGELLAALKGLRPRAAQIPIYSTVTGAPISGTDLKADYWWRNVREAVQFAPAISKLAVAGFDFYLELAAHPVLSASVRECLAPVRPGLVLSSMRRHAPERATLLLAAGTLHTRGVLLNWEGIIPGEKSLVALPNYRWKKEAFWNEPQGSRENRVGPSSHPLLLFRHRHPVKSWQGQLDRRTHSWLSDHRVQGHMVFPGAGYVEMGLSSAMQAAGSSTIQLEEVEFIKPLFIPSSGDVPTIQITHNASDPGFRVFSRRGDITNEWSVHASGSQRPLTKRAPKARETVEEIRERCTQWTTGEAFYEYMASCGLVYGPLFQAVQNVWYRPGESLAEIKLPPKLEAENARYAFHPSLMDACIQITTSTHYNETQGSEIRLRLPVFMERIRYYQNPGTRFWAHARLVRDSPSAAVYDCTVFNEQGEVTIEFKGMKGQIVHGNRASAHGPIEKLFYEQEWQLAPLSNHRSKARASDFFPSSSELATSLRKLATKEEKDLGLSVRYAEVKPWIDDFCSAVFAKAARALARSGPTRNGGGTSEVSEMTAAMVPAFERLQVRASARGGVEPARNGGSGPTERISDAAGSEAAWRKIVTTFPALLPEMILLDRCAQNLADILRGAKSPDEIMAPGGSTNQLEHFYANSFRFRVSYQLMRQAVGEVVGRAPEGRRLRVLEIGAGTGGLSEAILPALKEGLAEYYFTDKSAAYFGRAEQKLKDYPFVKYETFDLDQLPGGAPWLPQSFDLIIASSLFEAADSPAKSLSYLQSLLTPGGMMLLDEAVGTSWLDDLTFGLGRKNQTPVPTAGSWKSMLAEAGFAEVEPISLGEWESQRIIVIARGKSDLIANFADNANVSASRADRKKQTWLVFEDKQKRAREIGHELTLRGDDFIYARAGKTFARSSETEFEVDPTQPEDMVRLLRDLPPLQGILYFWSLDAGEGEAALTAEKLADAETLTCHGPLHLVKALGQTSIHNDVQLWLVTSGAQPAGAASRPLNVAQAPLIGLGRNIINELPDLRCRLVDLSCEQDHLETASLVDELSCDPADAEEEIALRGEARYRQRLVTRYDHLEHAPKEYAQATDVPCRLDAVRPGAIDGISFVRLPRRAPGPGEVEIEVCAAGVNFRDVMKSLGIYPAEVGDALLLGDECSGRIVSIGEGVTDFKIGDEVMTMGAGCFAPFLTQKAAVVLHKPSGFSMEEAATVLTSYTTAHYALRHLGRMRAGEKVLIHAAAGGVGTAAVQLALAAGAQVYATAGSPEKRRFLHLLGVEHVFDSRSLDFGEEILEVTEGRGVDLVLNSLAGEAISKSLNVLAPGGRFLEIGKRDIYMNTPVGLRPFRNNLSYFAIDLGRALEPEMIDLFLGEMKNLFRSPGIRPLPHRVFPASEAMEAFRHMTQARQIGKIVLDFRNARVPLTASSPPVSMRCKSDATYLVIGGVGGFGLATAEWLVENGARTLVLASRSAAPTPEAKQVIDRLEKSGVKVVLAKCDAAKEAELAALLEKIKSELPPLKGAIHSAMVLEDGLLLQSTAESFQRVMAPKVQGAWNLHCLTKELPLDMFVLYSSSSSTIGNPGQSNYCAANAFLDALSHLRRQMQLPSLTVNWGLLGEVGVITRDARLAEHFRRLGFEGLPTRTALNGLGFLILDRAVQTTVWDIDWSRWIEAPAHYARSKRYSLLTTVDALKQNQRGEGERLRAALDAAGESERTVIAQNCLCTQVAEVLRVPIAKIEIERPLNEQGMDSLMAVELMHRLDSNLGVSISPTKLIGKPTIVKLAESLLESLGKASKPTPNGENAVQMPSASAATKPGAVDYRKEIRLPDNFHVPDASLNIGRCENPKQIILTGPFEYLGLYLLNYLLAHTSARIVCFVSEKERLTELKALLFAQMQERNLVPKDPARVVLQAVEMAKPQFGLSGAAFDQLASETDFIIHNFAEINHIGSYESLKAANVDATVEVIRLAGAHHAKPVHYVSSITVFGASEAADQVGREDDPLDAPAKLHDGYDATRWVSEKCLRLAESRGLPVVIYRPGLMWGDSQNKVSTSDDFVWRLVLTCLALGRGPVGEVNLFFSPVDFVSRAIVAVCRRPGAFGKTFHVTSPETYRLENILVHAREAGYAMELVPWKKWEAELQDHRSPQAAKQLLPYLMFRGSLWTGMGQSESSFSIDSTNLQTELGASVIHCPPLTQELVESYLRDLVRLNLLREPELVSG